MKAALKKVNFKMKKNKTQTQKAIYLNEKYSANMRQMYLLLHEDKLPRQKFIKMLKNQLEQLQQNMEEQLCLYKPYENKELQKFLEENNIPNSYSLISLFEDKENQIQYLRSKLLIKKSVSLKENISHNKREQVQTLRKQLSEQTGRRVNYENKILKIKEQLGLQTRNLIENKIGNFDQEIQFRKYQALQKNKECKNFNYE